MLRRIYIPEVVKGEVEDLPLLSLDREMSRPATVIVQMLLMVMMILVIVILIAIKIKFSKLQQCQEILIDIVRKQKTSQAFVCSLVMFRQS